MVSLEMGEEDLAGLTGAKSQQSRFNKTLHYALPPCCFTRKFKWICGCSVFLIVVLIVTIVSVVAVAVNQARTQGKDSVRFIIVGGTGITGGGTTSQNAVASAMANYVNGSGAVPTPSFVLSTGDSFPSGLSGPKDPAFAQYFGNVYNQPQLKMPWHTVLGDLEYDGNATAAAQMSALDPRITVRRTGDTMKLVFPGSENWDVQPPALAAVVFVDTPPWVRMSRNFFPNYPAADYSGLTPPVPNPQQLGKSAQSSPLAGIPPPVGGNATRTPAPPPGKAVNATAGNATAAAQWQAWEDAQIAALDSALSVQWVQAAFWRVVVGHNCIISAGVGGPTADIGRIASLLQQRRVGLYICGHDWDMQLYGEDNFGMAHLVSAAGAVGDGLAGASGSNSVGAPLLTWSGAPGFMSVRLHPESLNVDIIGSDGSVRSSKMVVNPLFTP